MIPRLSARMALCGLAVLGALGTVVASGASAAAAGGSGTASDTVWLCQPGQAGDPCTSSPGSTTVTADGATSVTPSSGPATSSKFDCFYVYPTVSTQPRDNANLRVQAPEIGAAISQASRFSQVCRVWAPMYRQRTEGSLAKGLGGDPTADEVAYQSLLSGWKDYLAHDNDGRPIVFIGHSQGAAMLIRLLRSQIDPNARLRKQLVSAIILGGNVQVPTGKTVGGSFRHIPTCTSLEATGCVIAYSTFGTTPPPTSNFGRPGQGVSLQSDQTASAGQQVACVNPVTFSSASGPLLPYFPSVTSPVPGVKVDTPWVAFPGLYTARCVSQGGATWLQVTPTAVPRDPRPLVTAALGPDWGYHLDDVNLALGNLVSDVAREEAAYKR
ncbi:MAG: DUF3089 domain-containing protein [Acidimicrobiales bacterium]|jgi:hypothetical protein